MCWCQVGNRDCVHTFTEHADKVWDVSWSPNSARLVSAGDDGAIIVYGVGA